MTAAAETGDLRLADVAQRGDEFGKCTSPQKSRAGKIDELIAG